MHAPELEVYVDVLFTINFVMDFFILWATGKLINLRIKFLRLTLGALIGALYSLVILFTYNTLLTSFGIKVFCSVIMVLVSFAPVSPLMFIRTMAYLYIISFTMGGAVIAAIYLTDQTKGSIQVFNGAAVLSGNFNYVWLLAGLGVAFFIGHSGITYLRKNFIQNNLISSMEICFPGKKIKLKALLDTGNQLVDPLSRLPVVVVESQVLKSILPEILWNAVISDDVRLTELVEKLDIEWYSRLRLIPFNSVGRANGLMIGLRPEYIEIKNKKNTIKKDGVIIGLVSRKLNKDGKYQALLHPELIQQN